MTQQQLSSAGQLQYGNVLQPVEYKLDQRVVEKKVAYQGNVGSFSHNAALHFATNMIGGQETWLVPCRSFNEVFDKIHSDIHFYGAIPLENSSMGSIDANYDLLWSNSALIVAEVYVPVRHYLSAIDGAVLENIREVYSHPAALDQCRKLFLKYPNMKAVPHWDTSASALHIKEKNDPTLAAIASEKACQENELNILIANVEDYIHNATRFGLISKVGNAAEAMQTPYKMSLALELPHQPGSLAEVLTQFADIGVNLTTCKSRPNPALPWHYRFFVDLQIANADQHRGICEFVSGSSYNTRVLGRYPIGSTA